MTTTDGRPAGRRAHRRGRRTWIVAGLVAAALGVLTACPPVTPPTPSPSITISWGGFATGVGCVGSCKYVNGTMKNFTPNTVLTVKCRNVEGDFYLFTETTNSAGTVSWTNTHCSYGLDADYPVWLVSGAVESNHLARNW